MYFYTCASCNILCKPNHTHTGTHVTFFGQKTNKVLLFKYFCLGYNAILQSKVVPFFNFRTCNTGLFCDSFSYLVRPEIVWQNTKKSDWYTIFLYIHMVSHGENNDRHNIVITSKKFSSRILQVQYWTNSPAKLYSGSLICDG